MNFLSFIEQNGTALHKDAGDHLFRQGDSDSSMYVIKEGMLKAYYVTSEGKETIKSFLQIGDVIGSMSAAYAQMQNTFSLICLEPCTLIRFDFKALHSASLTDQELSKDVIEILLKFAMKKEQRERDLLCLSAQQRYEKLLDTSPDLIEKVTQNDIARYLGVTSVGLSRIKHRVMEST
ncbi:Crp/Fnr family transcriptional regulator [Vibrio penaeicida]|uniref:Cyclic nucleotide-binding domain-containing protein n=1 Tax=Vibrio penaeicida TaxID=104609 RepID=A0AAV5NQX1_9VIBR|nr:Crp/Fnr family transcriptional regulator [Vibrio penaeicida]RTZ19392.1 Crp/Fnr family transcriptional regulator [Vibrio penaeicida]GLQ73015.1 hypothetical protein GCM10007932_23750 [Vibrio penaeicida]